MSATSKALAIAGARVAETDLAVGKAGDRIDGSGELTDHQTRERLAEVVSTLAEQQRALTTA